MELLEQKAAQLFGSGDCSGSAMRRAIGLWYDLYYADAPRPGYDPCQRIAYTIVRKLTGAVFAEYAAEGRVCDGLEPVRREAVAQALIGGECYLKPLGSRWRCIPRPNILVLRRDDLGEPTDVVLAESSTHGGHSWLLLERRQCLDGFLQGENRLFRDGRPVLLSAHPGYGELPERFSYPGVTGVGLVRVKTPIANCVDGSGEGVSVYAPAVGLIRRIGENEAALTGEFEKGKSRLVVSRDMLRDGQLSDDLFIGLDESPDSVGITVFSPELREQSYLNRQQAYLRAVENVVGLKRGLLSQVEAVERTATEITSSEGEYAATIRDFQRMWHAAADAAAELLAQMEGREAEKPTITWGDGVLDGGEM